MRAASVPADPAAEVHAAAARGTATPATTLPFLGQIQRAFGRHDVAGIKAHVGPDAAATAREIGAHAYATGDHVVLGEGADLHTVAHETAHVVQQRGGIQLKGGVGGAGDVHERHAEAVADLVVQGKSAEAELDRHAGDPTSSPVHGAGGSSGDAPVQAMWPFDGPSIFSAEFWSGGQQQQPQQPPPPQPRQPGYRELARRAAAENQAASRGQRRETQQRLQALPGQLRVRLVAVETQLTQAAATLPARVREPWPTDEPDAVEGQVRPEIQRLPGAGHGHFRYERDASEAEQRTVELERVGQAYATYCAAIRASLVQPCLYFTTYAAGLPLVLVGQIDAACRAIAGDPTEVSEVQQTFKQLMGQAQDATAVDSAALYNEMQATPGVAQQRVHDYFRLGRLRIGHNRSFYASDYDAPAGSFGGEWALEAVDPRLADVAKRWVYHTHCDATGDKTTHDYNGFTIRRGVGASHIKRIVDRLVAGVSITVHCPPEFDRIELADRQRFLAWVDDPEGMAAIRKQKRQ